MTLRRALSILLSFPYVTLHKFSSSNIELRTLDGYKGFSFYMKISYNIK